MMTLSLVAPLVILIFQMMTFQQQINSGHMMNLPEAHPYFVFYNEFKQKALDAFLIALGISFSLTFVVGLLISHRIAGPLVKLKKHFENVAENQAHDGAIHFRDHDFFTELARAYNLKFKKTSKK